MVHNPGEFKKILQNYPACTFALFFSMSLEFQKHGEHGGGIEVISLEAVQRGIKWKKKG